MLPTHLARFNTFMRKAKRSTLVHKLGAWRIRGFDAEDFVDFILRPGDTLPKTPTRADYIRFLASASPIMTAILKEIRDHVIIGEKTKLLITKNVPVVAWFWQVVISLLQVRDTTIHSGLTQKERSRVSKEFNDSASSLSVLIIMYVQCWWARTEPPRSVLESYCCNAGHQFGQTTCASDQASHSRSQHKSRRANQKLQNQRIANLNGPIATTTTKRVTSRST